MDTRPDAATSRPRRPDKTRAARNTKHLTKELFDRYTKERPREQKIIWDEEETGLCVLEWKNDISPHLSNLAAGKYRSNGKRIGTPSVARSVRSHLVTLFNWYVDEYSSEKFRSPMVRTRKTKKWKTEARERNLDRDELRLLWAACDQVGGPYPALVKTALLTGQRFRKVGQMQRRDLKERVTAMDGTVVRHVWDRPAMVIQRTSWSVWCRCQNWRVR